MLFRGFYTVRKLVLINATIIFLAAPNMLHGMDQGTQLADKEKIPQSKNGNEGIRILVDMDGVVANFEEAILKNYQIRYPDKPFIPLTERKLWYVVQDYCDRYGGDYKSIFDEIYSEKGFFKSLPIIEGAKDALNQMIDKGFEVYLCTSPLLNYKNCVLEKFDWVNDNIGEEWTKRIILTRDKTIITGHIIIDDKPCIEGSENSPSWIHVLFDQPYNSHEDKPRIKNWKDWESVLGYALDQKNTMTMHVAD